MCAWYKVYADVYILHCFHKIYFLLLDGPDSVLLFPNVTSYVINEGDFFPKITCIATCNPNCIYTWTGGKAFKSTKADGNFVLQDVRKQDEGRYKCTTRNTVTNVTG